MSIVPDSELDAEKPKLNTVWHAHHRMGKNPTLEQRITWHIEHVKHCGCRPMPESIKKALKK